MKINSRRLRTSPKRKPLRTRPGTSTSRSCKRVWSIKNWISPTKNHKLSPKSQRCPKLYTINTWMTASFSRTRSPPFRSTSPSTLRVWTRSAQDKWTKSEISRIIKLINEPSHHHSPTLPEFQRITLSHRPSSSTTSMPRRSLSSTTSLTSPSFPISLSSQN